MFWKRYPAIKRNSANYGKIELENVHVSFDSKNIILNDFVLNIDKGKYVSILGTSGIGKTTLLRAISGFKRITSGYIRINGQLASSGFSHMPPENRNLGFVFQDYALFPHLNVFENEEGINLEYNYNGQFDSLSVLRDGDKINTIKEDKFLDNKGIIKNKEYCYQVIGYNADKKSISNPGILGIMSPVFSFIYSLILISISFKALFDAATTRS